MEHGGETFPQRLHRLRMERNMSQRKLECKGVSYAYISRLEAGQRKPSVRVIRKIAHRLGVNPAYLETGRMGVCPHCGGTPDPNFS